MDYDATVNKRYLPLLSKLFSPIVIGSLINKGHSDYLSEVLQYSGIVNLIDKKLTIANFFDWMYHFLAKHYRNEYIYKNVIANKILLGKHSLNTSHMLTEFRVLQSKADVVILNGTSTVYEIKSEYDSFNRLNKQLSAYIKVFDKINVITTEIQAKSLIKTLPEEIGILTLSDKDSIKTIREPKSQCDKVIPEVIFDTLRRQEYMDIVKRHFNNIPDFPNTKVYLEYKNMFCTLPPRKAHEEMVVTLRKRNECVLLKEFVKNAPISLKAYAIGANLNRNDVDKCYHLLNTELKTVLSTVPA